MRSDGIVWQLEMWVWRGRIRVRALVRTIDDEVSDAVRYDLAAICMSVLALSGCAGWSPVVAGDGYFGVGLHRDHRDRGAATPDYVDVEGVGLLLAKGRAALGYSKLCYVSADAESEFRLKMTGAEIAIGADADTWAMELNALNERELAAEAEKEGR